jgi:hypothetical protein
VSRRSFSRVSLEFAHVIDVSHGRPRFRGDLNLLRSITPPHDNESDSTAFGVVERRVNRSAQLTKDTPSSAPVTTTWAGPIPFLKSGVPSAKRFFH